MQRTSRRCAPLAADACRLGALENDRALKPALSGLSHRVGYAAFISLASGVAALLPTRDHPLRALLEAVAYLDAPISTVGLLLPSGMRGVWLFWPAKDVLCRSVGPDAAVLLVNQVLIGIPTYVGIFYLPLLVRTLVRRYRARRAPTSPTLL